MDYPVNDAVMDACRHAATIAGLIFQELERGLARAGRLLSELIDIRLERI